MHPVRVSALLLIFLLAACGPAAATPPADPSPPATQPAVVPSETQAVVATPDPVPGVVLSGKVEIEIEDFEFRPAVVTIKAGTTVVWKHRDDVPHTVTSDLGDWSSGRLSDRGEFSRVFDQPGTLTYFCELHPSMQGTIIVVP
jgi:plastocyanin